MQQRVFCFVQYALFNGQNFEEAQRASIQCRPCIMHIMLFPVQTLNAQAAVVREFLSADQKVA